MTLAALLQRLQSARFITRMALVLVVLLTTHSFLCVLSAHLLDCKSSSTSVSTAVSVSQVSPLHDHAEVCCRGVDENKLPAAFMNPLRPSFTITYALWALLLTMLAPLLPGAAAIFGRDGTVEIPDQNGLVIRSCLPHRAPPAFLA